MRKPLHIILFILLSGILLQRCSCERMCTHAIPEINFTNFDSTELRVVILKEYHQDGKFGTPINTLVYSQVPVPGPDTLPLTQNTIIVGGLSDYSVFVPVLNRTWYIKISLHNDGVKNSGGCTSSMTYWVNDTIHVIPTNITSADLPGNIIISK